MSMRYALTGKLFRGPVEFSAASRVLQSIAPQGGGGGFQPADYSVVGLPLVRAVDTVTIVTAADNDAYSVTVKGRTITINSGGGATVTSIRDALDAAFTVAIEAALGVVVSTNGADELIVTANTPGDALNTAVTADVPANISVALGMASNAGNTPVGVAAKHSGQIDVRAAAAITASFEVAIIG